MVDHVHRAVGASVRAFALAGLVLALGAGAAAAQQQAQPRYLETAVDSTAPDAGIVSESYVSLYAPRPAADGPRPAACDRIGYLRFRAAGGPSNPARAAAIFVAQPGIFESAGALDQVARNTVRAALNDGYDVEFWALNRRSNCLTDEFGVQAAAAAHDPQLAVDYYYDGKSVDGHTFPGFATELQAAFLSQVGLAQTLRDEYTVIRQLPPRVRRTRVLCGGHSLGGILTGAFANFDFSGSGDPAQAGYNQCAGYFALDTRFTMSLTTTILSDVDGGVVNSVLQSISAGWPYINVAPFSPDVFAALPILGLAAYDDPDGKLTLVDALPDDDSFNFTYDVLFSSSWLGFLTDTPDVRQFNLTNEAAIGAIFGDVSDPIGILRASVGVPTGGPVVEKNFPVDYGTPAQAAGLLGGNDLIAPDPSQANPNGTMYGWLNYDQVPTPGPSPVDDPGHPYTSSASQVSDITQLSRALFQAPATFTENYFPVRLLLDMAAAAYGDRSGGLAGLRYSNGISLRPAAYVDGGEGITPSLGDLSAVPPGAAPQVHVVAPGYNHLDVVTAAWKQNDGRPEITSATLASWMSQIVGSR
jgi:hypothetical protein